MAHELLKGGLCESINTEYPMYILRKTGKLIVLLAGLSHQPL